MSAPEASLVLAPLEETSSFLRGSALGAEAVAAELARIDSYDPAVGAGLDALGAVGEVRLPEVWRDLPEAIAALRKAVEAELEAGRFPLTLGGEHTVTLGPLAAVRERLGDVGLVQLDAHADLRDQYEGRALSHACVVRRATGDLGLSALGLGVRSMSLEERTYARESGLVSHLGPRGVGDRGALLRALDELPPRVYVTVDMDVFDPSVAPGVGTPEAGGLHWDEVGDLIDLVAERKQIVGADIVELAPRVEQERTARLAARVAIRVLLRSLVPGLGGRREPGERVVDAPGSTPS